MAIGYESRGGIAYLSFCRPEKHNAMRDEDLQDLVAALRRFDLDDSVGVGIVFGQGKSFCSGSDVVHRMQRSFNDGGGDDGPSEMDAFLETRNWKPTIAAIDGYCLGQGIGVAFLCDLVLATRRSRFQVTEALIGVPSASFVDRLGGGRLSLDAGMTGRFFSGEEIDNAGMLARLVEDDQHVSAAEEIATQILANPQGAVRELVRYRRGLIAERMVKTRNIAGSYDWAADEEAKERIVARIAHHK